MSNKNINRGMLTWLLGCLVFWAWYLSFREFAYQTLYFYVWLIVFGLPLWLCRQKIRRLLQDWKLKGRPKFLLLGYGTVLLEEIFAALFNHLSEGFGFLLYLQRIGQFWALNVFAFTGFVVGWWALVSRLKYSDAEVFAAAFQTRGLGKIIGIDSLGYVIGTGGLRTIDNGFVRRPTGGLWVLPDVELIEGVGVKADIQVRNEPNDLVAGKDAQLEAAVAYLLEQIKENPVPKPEDYKLEIPAQ